ncbi:MAG: cation:proton antiporter [Halofilum sp. (in: g-proteobacteria)]
MTSTGWFLIVGLVLLAIGLTQPLIKRLPLTNTMVYLVVGVVLGPTVLGVFHFNPLQQSPLLGVIAEVAVLLSLFTAGMKMPVPFTAARWRTPILVAFAAMAVTAALLAALGYFALGLPLGAAILLGGILAPTDPVLASEVQVRHPGDRDRLRFFLTSEAGMNDGSAYPVVMLGLGLLGLHELGGLGLRWAFLDVLWATAGGIGLGVIIGHAVGRIVYGLRKQSRGTPLFDDFIGLGMVAVVYGTSVAIGAGGFLAVFFAAVALRQTEVKLKSRATAPALPASSSAPRPQIAETGARRFGITENSMDIHEALERLAELMLILLLGGTLFTSSWSWHGLGVALFLFCIARPAGTMLVSKITRTPVRLRGMIDWFGVRGIGSLYYLMFAIQAGLAEELALELLHITLLVVTTSIIVHGISVKPAMARFRHRGARVVREAM